MRRRQTDLGFQQEWCCNCRSWLLIRSGEKWRKSVTEELVRNGSVAWWLRDSGGWLQGSYWGKQLEWDRKRKKRCGRGKADWITDFESGTLFVMMRSKVWYGSGLFKWRRRWLEKGWENQATKEKLMFPCLHGFIMRSMAGLHFKRIVQVLKKDIP